MKRKLGLRLVACAVMMGLIMGPVTAYATDVAGLPSEATATEEDAVAAEERAAEAAGITKTGTVSAGGVTLTSTVDGAYAVHTLAGMAITTPASEIAEDFDLGPGEKPSVRAYDIDEKTSPAAYASINAAADAVGAEVIGAINIDLGKMSGGKFVQLPNGAGVLATVGIPGKKIDPAKTYAAVRVVPGGAITILYDQDTNPNTVTFVITGGLAAYAIIAF